MPEGFDYGLFGQDLYEKGIKIREQAYPTLFGDQSRFRYSGTVELAASTNAVYDLYTVPTSQNLTLSAIRISNDKSTIFQQAYVLHKHASDGSYYVLDGAYFLRTLSLDQVIGYQIPAGDSLAVKLWNNSGSATDFLLIFTGLTESKK